VEEARRVTANLLPTLSALFPYACQIERQLQELVQKAVDVSNMMAEEKQLFFCSVYQVECNFEEEYMEPSGDRCEGQVRMCMFPCFTFMVKEEGAETERCLVKADVELYEYM
jgi:hypothetical protein